MSGKAKKPKVASERPATAREHLFAERYVICLNATQAAKEAGCSPRSAHVTGSRLLNKARVKALIQEAVRQRTEAAGVTADRVLLELACIAYSDLRNVLHIDEQGMVHIKPLDGLPETVTRAISEITQTSTEHLDEVEGKVVEKVRLGIKQHSKIEALKVLVRYLGLEAPTKTQNEHTGANGQEIKTETKVKAAGKLSDAVADLLVRKVLVGDREG